MTAKFVPRILMTDQVQQCVDVCTEIQQLASEEETFFQGLSQVFHDTEKKKPTENDCFKPYMSKCS